MKTRYSELDAYVTKDGSQIRELIHPAVHGGGADQSLAEAVVPPGRLTVRHRHHRSQEIYHITSGCGRMLLNDDWFAIASGDSVRIEPGQPHQLHNHGEQPLVVLCVCSPAYSHDDTELLDAPDEPSQDHSC